MFLAFLAGIVCKLYDDLDDNIYLKRLKDPPLMEALKGLHYILFTTLSIFDPLFFIISYIGNFLHNLKNDDSFKKPYEASLLYSFLILFFIIDYTKIVGISLLDYCYLISFLFWMGIEPLLKFPEYSYNKLYFRLIIVFSTIISSCIMVSNTTKNIMLYVLGYFMISVFVQYYSLKQKDTKKLKHKNKNKHENKNKN